MDVLQPAEMESRKGPGVPEIERRFLVKYLPPDVLAQLNEVPYEDMRQGYLPERAGRIRHCVSSEGLVSYKRGRKKPPTNVTAGVEKYMEEPEQPLTAEEFEELWAQTESRIVKRRYYLPLDGHMAELDVLRGETIDGRMLVEVEFETDEGAQQFTPPEWFGEEMTNKVGNRMLATHHPIALFHILHSATYELPDAA